MENFLSLKQAEFYVSGIDKLVFKWQEAIQNDGQYTTYWNEFIVE